MIVLIVEDMIVLVGWCSSIWCDSIWYDSSLFVFCDSIMHVVPAMSNRHKEIATRYFLSRCQSDKKQLLLYMVKALNQKGSQKVRKT